MKSFLRAVRADQAGSTVTEYALIASLVAAVLIGAVSGLGETLRSTFEAIGSALP
jgi:Flp pilus assembly pilin Flp